MQKVKIIVSVLLSTIIIFSYIPCDLVIVFGDELQSVSEQLETIISGLADELLTNETDSGDDIENEPADMDEPSNTDEPSQKETEEASIVEEPEPTEPPSNDWSIGWDDELPEGAKGALLVSVNTSTPINYVSQTL